MQIYTTISILGWILGAVTAEVFPSEAVVSRFYVFDAISGSFKYNHDSSIARWKASNGSEYWISVWNGNTVPREGQKGQKNYLSFSTDLQHWRTPVLAFPTVTCEADSCLQWQPNLVPFSDGKSVGCMWSQDGSDATNAGAYWSVLHGDSTEFSSQHLLFDGSPDPVFENKSWSLFPSQDPVTLLRTCAGRILAPVVLTDLTDSRAPDAPANVSGFFAKEKRASVLWSDDAGKSWNVSYGTQQPNRSWSMWEPTVFEGTDGLVYMFDRNNDERAPLEGGPMPWERLQMATSSDCGQTWTPLAPVPVDVVVSRMHVVGQPFGETPTRRWMSFNDYAQGKFVEDRFNGAVFLNTPSSSTSAQNAHFVPAGPFSARNEISAYPQLAQQFVNPNSGVVVYSSGDSPRSIRVANVTIPPSPSTQTPRIFPRRNTPDLGQPWVRVDGIPSWRFLGSGQTLSTNNVHNTTLNSTTISLAAWLGPSLAPANAQRPAGLLLDSRTPDVGNGGISWGFEEETGCPFLYVGVNVYLPSNASVCGWYSEEYVFFAVVVDLGGGKATFYRNKETSSISFPPNPTRPFFPNNSATIGGPSIEHSALVPLAADVRVVAAFPGALSESQLFGFANSFAASIHQPPLQPSSTPPPFSFSFDATQPTTNYVSPPIQVGAGYISNTSIVTCGNASYAIEGFNSESLSITASNLQLFQSPSHSSSPPAANTVLFTFNTGAFPVKILVDSSNNIVLQSFQNGRLQPPSKSLTLGPRPTTPFAITATTTTKSVTASLDNHPPQTVQTSNTIGTSWAFLGDGFPPFPPTPAPAGCTLFHPSSLSIQPQ